MGRGLESARLCGCCAVLCSGRQLGETAVQGAVSSGFTAVADWEGVTYHICCLLALDCWRRDHGHIYLEGLSERFGMIK